MARTILVSDGGLGIARDIEDAALANVLAEPPPGTKPAVIWVDLAEPTPEDYAWLSRHFHFHQLAIEDCQHGVQRPKVEEYDDYLFFVFHAITGLGGGEDERRDEDLDFIELDGFLGERYLVTVHTEPFPLLDQFRARILSNPALLARGADDLFHAILDAAVDLYFPLLDLLDDRLDRLEEELFSGATARTLEEIFGLKKLILRLRRFANPQRDTLSLFVHHEYAVVDERTRYYLRDVFDHLNRINDTLDAYRDLIAGAADTYISLVSQRTNDAVKVLSIFATIMLPLGLIAGLYGTNFRNLPGAGAEYGFLIMLGGMVLMSLVLLGIFWRRGWFRRG